MIGNQCNEAAIHDRSGQVQPPLVVLRRPQHTGPRPIRRRPDASASACGPDAHRAARLPHTYLGADDRAFLGRRSVAEGGFPRRSYPSSVPSIYPDQVGNPIPVMRHSSPSQAQNHRFPTTSLHFSVRSPIGVDLSTNRKSVNDSLARRRTSIPGEGRKNRTSTSRLQLYPSRSLACQLPLKGASRRKRQQKSSTCSVKKH